ncbi:MAG: restriction endonuclease subunit S [Lachnospiraceae bacterium]|nr:restriction endonuclease subunit S [Lachnospiraceae bacterium]
MAKLKTQKTISIEERLEAALVPENEQPYEVPENWCWVKLGCLYEVNPKNDADDDVEASFIPMEQIEAGMVSAFTYDINVWGKIRKGHTQFADGDVAFAKISPCFENRKSMLLKGLVNGIGAGTTELIVLRQLAVNPKYTFWIVSNEDFIRGGCATYSGTVGQQRISMDYVRNYPIPFPPLAEQRRIVERIESLFSKLDEARDKAQEALNGFETRKVAILHDAFSGKLTEHWRSSKGIDMSSWGKIALKDCGDWFGGGTPNTNNKEYWDNGTIPWVTSKDMKVMRIDDSQLHITRKGVDNSSANYCDKPAVLFVMRSGILRRIFPVCMINIPFTVNQDLKAIIPKGIEQEYLYWVCTGYEKDIRDNCMKDGTTVESVEAKKLMAYQIPLATSDEQREIVRIIDKLMEKEEQTREVAEEVIFNIEALKKSILAKAFRGELGTNNPEEESAIELLKQVLETKE